MKIKYKLKVVDDNTGEVKFKKLILICKFKHDNWYFYKKDFIELTNSLECSVIDGIYNNYDRFWENASYYLENKNIIKFKAKKFAENKIGNIHLNKIKSMTKRGMWIDVD